MLFRRQRQRLPQISEPRLRPKVERKRGPRLRKGPRLRLRRRKMQIKGGRQGRQRRNLRLRLWRGQGHGLMPNKGRRKISPGFLPRLERISSFSNGRGIMPTL